MEDSGKHGYLGGESYQDVLDRVLPPIDQLLRDFAGQSIAVVAHKAVNRSLLTNLLGLDMRHAKDLPQENCCVNIITAQAGNAKLKTVNSALHIAAL